MSEYFEHQPIGKLSDFVKCIWSYRTNDADPEQTIVPDGRPELVLHLADPYTEYGEPAPQPLAIFAGQITRPLRLVPGLSTDIIAVRFHPDGARPFIGCDLSTTTDRRIDMTKGASAIPETLISELKAESDRDSHIEILSRFLEIRIGDSALDPVVRQTVQSIVNGTDPLPLEDLTARQFQRRFLKEVGVGARLFKSIRRFRSVFDRLSDDPNQPWVLRALESGYFDQPQLSRDFQRFLGMSASAWIHHASGLGLALGSKES